MSQRSNAATRWGALILSGALLMGFCQVSQAETISHFDSLTQQQIEQSYYHDWNRNPKFRSAVRSLFTRSKVAQPEWVRYGAGPSAPSRVVSFAGENWVLLNTCYSKDCDGNQLFVLFYPPQRQTYGVAKLKGEVVWLGNPDESKKAVLTQVSGYQ